MANNSSIVDKSLDIVVIKLGHLVKVKIRKGTAEVFPFAQYGQPGEAGLKSLKADFFKQLEIIVLGQSPLLVVVSSIVILIVLPVAAHEAVGTENQTRCEFITHND